MDNFEIEQQAKTKWQSDPKVRAEFNDNFEAYLAYEKVNANGQIKVMGAGRYKK